RRRDIARWTAFFSPASADAGWSSATPPIASAKSHGDPGSRSCPITLLLSRNRFFPRLFGIRTGFCVSDAQRFRRNDGDHGSSFRNFRSHPLLHLFVPPGRWTWSLSISQMPDRRFGLAAPIRNLCADFVEGARYEL